METNKNNVLIIGLVTLTLGVVIGYFVGINRPMDSQMGATTSQSAYGDKDTHVKMEGMDGLEGKTGDALDLAFLNAMIIHHEGAVEMATTLLKGTKRPELIKIGNEVITAQAQEIGMMKQWRKDWFNK